MAQARRWLLAVLAAATLWSAADARADQDTWSGTLWWEPGADPELNADGLVRLHGWLSFRSTEYYSTCGAPQVGQVLPGTSTGDLEVGGVPITYSLRIDYVDASLGGGHCRFAGRVIDTAMEEGVLLALSGPAQATWSSCCRLPASENAAGTDVQLATTLVPDGNASARIGYPALGPYTPHGSKAHGLQHCPAHALCRFYIPAKDPDGDPLTWRLASSAEAGDAAFTQPGSPWTGTFFVNQDTGLVTWDTRATEAGEIYSAQIIVSDGTSDVPIEFTAEIIAGCSDGTYGSVEASTQELTCRQGPAEPSRRCQEDPDDDGCRPVPPPGGGGRPYRHDFSRDGRFQPPVYAPAVPSDEPRRYVFDSYVGDQDPDEDGFDDRADLCPDVASPDNSDLDGDGQAPPCDEDDDGDGMVDEMDACPADPEPRCGVESEGKDVVSHAPAPRGFFAQAPAPEREAVAVQVQDSETPGPSWPVLALVAGAILMALLGGRRRKR